MRAIEPPFIPFSPKCKVAGLVACTMSDTVACLVQVVNAWLKCFHAIVPLLDKTLIKAKILPVALAKGANDETSVQSRVICCAMLGSMAACLTKVSSRLCHGKDTFVNWLLSGFPPCHLGNVPIDKFRTCALQHCTTHYTVLHFTFCPHAPSRTLPKACKHAWH